MLNTATTIILISRICSSWPRPPLLPGPLLPCPIHPITVPSPPPSHNLHPTHPRRLPPLRNLPKRLHTTLSHHQHRQKRLPTLGLLLPRRVHQHAGASNHQPARSKHAWRVDLRRAARGCRGAPVSWLALSKPSASDTVRPAAEAPNVRHVQPRDHRGRPHRSPPSIRHGANLSYTPIHPTPTSWVNRKDVPASGNLVQRAARCAVFWCGTTHGDTTSVVLDGICCGVCSAVERGLVGCGWGGEGTCVEGGVWGGCEDTCTSGEGGGGGEVWSCAGWG